MAVRTALVVSSLAVAPTLVLPPPLKSTGPSVTRPIEQRVLTEVGLAGHALYSDHCADCHGSLASGTRAAPSLHTVKGQNGITDQQAFHLGVRRPAHMVAASGTPPAKLSFNEIELVGRYVREAANPGKY